MLTAPGRWGTIHSPPPPRCLCHAAVKVSAVRSEEVCVGSGLGRGVVVWFFFFLYSGFLSVNDYRSTRDSRFCPESAVAVAGKAASGV